MKKIKDLYKYLIGFLLGIAVIGGISVYAVEAVIESKEVSYDNKESHGNFTDVQGSIDELYERSGIMKNRWVDPILNGADPVLGQDMIPVTIDDNGTVHYANLYTKWYEYETKKWANAVILTDTGKSKNYKTNDEIAKDDIESYFVWIPRYKYKIWNLGNYTSVYKLEDLKDSNETVNSEFAARYFTGKEQLIDVVFETKDVPPSKEEKIDSYYTHPAFINFNVNGLWIGKFEVAKNSTNITVKPGITSWRLATVGTFWHKLYDYKRDLDSHMMKNTEWGAVAYLSHSIYGTGKEININNNSDCLTGYSAVARNNTKNSYDGTVGTTKDVTQPWNTPTGYLASTTGNITGIYDMSGGAWEYVAGYMDGYGVESINQVNSGLTISDLTNYAKYFDKYANNSNYTLYNNRILGDATGELGPFYSYTDTDKNRREHSAWYGDTSAFLYSYAPWFYRGGAYYHEVLAGQFNFVYHPAGGDGATTCRLVLAVQ